MQTYSIVLPADDSSPAVYTRILPLQSEVVAGVLPSRIWGVCCI